MRESSLRRLAIANNTRLQENKNHLKKEAVETPVKSNSFQMTLPQISNPKSKPHQCTSWRNRRQTSPSIYGHQPSSTEVLKRHVHSMRYSKLLDVSPKAPCSTSSLHYIPHKFTKPLTREVRSATRHNNPHPVGLVFQSPYNRNGQDIVFTPFCFFQGQLCVKCRSIIQRERIHDSHNNSCRKETKSKIFEIWSPDQSHSKHITKLTHIVNTNFTCGSLNSVPFRFQREPAEIHHNVHSMYQMSYTRPQEKQNYDTSTTTTRFGNSCNRLPSVGIVPI